MRNPPSKLREPIKATLRSVACQEPSCVGTLTTMHPTKKFCSPTCSKLWQKRQDKRNRMIGELARAWRNGPRDNEGRQKAAELRGEPRTQASRFLVELSRLVDGHLREDREIRAAAHYQALR